MQMRHSMVVATTPQNKNGLADPTRLLCLPLAQLSSKTHSAQGRSNKTSVSFGTNICVSGKLPNHHCAWLHVLHVVHTKHQGQRVQAFMITFQRYPQAVC
eukprot:6657342-Ditylum_brightwellii.AAC.1